MLLVLWKWHLQMPAAEPALYLVEQIGTGGIFDFCPGEFHKLPGGPVVAADLDGIAVPVGENIAGSGDGLVHPNHVLSAHLRLTVKGGAGQHPILIENRALDKGSRRLYYIVNLHELFAR